MFRILSSLLLQFKKNSSISVMGKTDRDKCFLNQCFLFLISDSAKVGYIMCSHANFCFSLKRQPRELTVNTIFTVFDKTKKL